MTESAVLPQIIDVVPEKCVNCHRCIGVCPVKYCNNASDTGKGITVDSNLCIGCGACLRACSHDARVIVDDTEQFFRDLEKGVKISAMLAPAAAVHFYENLGHFLGWLKARNVMMNFDVSFGAEITTYQYLKAIRSGVATPVIAQPCPAVVNFIEIYKPQLIKHLAPTGSPAMDMACWVHARHPGMKLAFISPCVAKKREFADPNTKARVHYNVTIANLEKYMQKHGVKLPDFPSIHFDGPIEAERGLLYSQPGGLHEAFKRYQVPLKAHQVRRTEGHEIYEEFFEELERDIANNDCDVILVDILNCSHGCNKGTGMPGNGISTGTMLRRQSLRMDVHFDRYYPTGNEQDRLENALENMDEIDFSRTYSDKSGHYKKLADPTQEMISILHLEMKKTKHEDKKNCGACGYHSCDNMAKAILNGLYRPEQCHHYLEHVAAGLKKPSQS